MIRGFYTAASGMIAGLLRHETILHNLTNIRTIGFKADRTASTDFPSLLLSRLDGSGPVATVGEVGTGVTLTEVTTDFSAGPLQLTDHPLDFAIAGDGFFRVQTPEGVRYTRDGRFQRDAAGRLVTASGEPVLGPDGPIVIPEGQLLATAHGELFVNDVLVGRLSLARPDGPDALVKVSQTMFASRGPELQPVPLQEIEVRQGYLEGANVDPSQEMTEMMSVLRAYQLSQRLVQLQDHVLAQTVNDLGRI